jgi:hypothetical protein
MKETPGDAHRGERLHHLEMACRRCFTQMLRGNNRRFVIWE